MNLYSTEQGVVIRILEISTSRSLRRNLAQMGIQIGDTVLVHRRVPFKGPILIEHRGTVVAMGRSLAESIRVEIVE
jgi:Fe2+ transport system protein FeoA